ncbi:MAG TPA: hypothetical protein PLP61_14250 [Nocardioides sp.]|uniref:hypothetical protein n=1 Tax=Nocardioides sp. TaxID=35761 RepID=UPI002CEF81E1|nr:hypothetical protein [Nocardioides sp.]HQR28198.1 hypothetical protein [Nocardioides sp.]
MGHTPSSRRTLAARAAKRSVAVSAVLAIAVACGTEGQGGKGGLSPRDTPVFGYVEWSADSYGFAPGGPAFIDAVAEDSDGLLAPSARSMFGLGREGLVKAVVEGRVEGAWVPSSVLESLGVGRFAALSAPLAITTSAAAAAVTEPSVAPEFLETLDGSGLTGLALFAGPLVRPAAADEPLLGPPSWRRVHTGGLSPVEAETVAALGGTVGDPGYNAQLVNLPRALQEDIAVMYPYLTANVVLTASPWVLVVNSQWFESLSDQEQDWLRAGAEAGRLAAIQRRGSEADLASRLCAGGARFAEASAAELTALHLRVEPVLREIAASPADSALLDLVRSVASAASSGPVEPLAVPRSCRGKAAPREQVDDYPRTPVAIAPGTYRAHLSTTDISEAGFNKTRDAQVVTLVISEDGTYTSTSRFDDDGSSMIFESGRVFGSGDRAFFVNSLASLQALRRDGENACDWTDATLHCITNSAPYSVRWSVDENGALSFSDPRGMNPDPVSILSLVANPFQPVR